MKINISNVKQIPKGISDKFGMCVYAASITDEITAWIAQHQMSILPTGPYINFYTNKKMEDLFHAPMVFEYMDGFSPNLNKHLHIGHFSNLVLAKAFWSLGVAKKRVSILGDTLDGDVSNEEGLATYFHLCHEFKYSSHNYFASSVKYYDDLLKEGEGEFAGTKIFEIGDKKIVGIKSDGSTSYFYQDAAFASTLSGPTLYLTGSEQSQHFALLKKLFSWIEHIPMGLVKAKGSKMSSRKGNVLLIKDVVDYLVDIFGDHQLAYNVFAGHILKSAPKVEKNIDMDLIANPLNSSGLYLSYTLAKLKSVGLNCTIHKDLVSQELQFNYLRSRASLSPNLFFESLINHAHLINTLYNKYTIKDNRENKNMFTPLGEDLATGMSLLGLFPVEKV